MAKKERLDVLVQRLMGVSRSKAQALIHTGQVYDDRGQKLDKPARRVPENIVLRVRERPRYVSRGGEKLEAALRAFPIVVEGRVAIDVGASTGGFTDCLLQRGAARVYAVDVGYGQLAWSLRNDPRVVLLERVNIRYLKPEAFPERPNLFTVDCSFISLRVVLPALKELLAPQAEGVVLIKPQFEAGPEEVSRGGVVRDPEVRQRIASEVLQAAEGLGFVSRGVIPCPVLGPAGNQEFLAHLHLTQ